MSSEKPKTIGELRKFGLIMAVPLSLIGGLMLWRGRAAGPYMLALAAFFLITGLVVPGALEPVERIWMEFARRLSVVMTYVILTLTFYLVITPVGLLLRLLGKDLLGRQFDPKMHSYWTPVEPDGPCSRADKPY